MVPGSILDPAVNSTNFIAYNITQIYTFTFTPEHTIPQNGKISIILPSAVTVFNSTLASACRGRLNTGTEVGYNCTVNG